MSERLRVLLVEDNPADADLIRETLPTTGPVAFRLAGVERLSEALARLEQEAFDLVLLDLALPDSQGLATYSRLKEVAPGIPTIVLTGNEDEEVAISAVRLGAQDYLIKGQVVGNVLARAARYAVERSRAEEALRYEHAMLERTEGVAHVGSWEWEIASDTVTWSDELFRIFQRDPREGAPSFAEHPALYPSEDMARLQQAVEAAVAEGTPYELELRAIRKDGETRVCVARGIAEMPPGGHAVRLYGSLQDITERRRAEEEQRTSESRFSTVFRASPLSIAIARLKDGVFVDVNGAWERLTGFSREEAIGRRWIELNFWVDAGQREQMVRNMSELGTVRGVEVQVRQKGGAVRDLLMSAEQIDFAGEPCLLTTALDITTRKRGEEALRESEEKFRGLFESSRDALMTLEPPSWEFTAGNPAAVKMFGAKDEREFITHGPRGLSPERQPDGRASAAASLEMIETAVREGSHSFEWTHRRIGGEEFPADVLLTRMTQGREVTLQATVRDITERKLAEEKIVHLNRLLRAIRDINQLIVRERDRQRLIEDASRLLVESRGYGSAIVILTDAAGVPRAWAEAGMGDAFQPLAESLRRGVLPECCRLSAPCEGVYHVTDREEVCRICPIGAPLASTVSSCIRLRHGETTHGYLAVSVDRMLGTDEEEDSLLGEVAGDVAFALHGIERGEAMTQAEEDRDRAEAALRQSQKMEAIGRLAGGVAHDFNNILTVITASCSFLEDGLHAPDPLLDDVRTVREAAQSAVKLTRQLLAFGRRQVLEPRPLDLNALVAESEKMLGRLIGEDVAIRIEPAPALGFALADPGQIEQVIINLAVNSRDAMPDGGTLTIATANVELGEAFVSLHAGSSAGPFVRLAVSDTGVGMDAETVVRIFEPFFTTKAVGKGTGLGLSTVYGIVKQSGGFIAVDSAPGHGATFAIYLPRVEPAGQPWRPPTEALASRGRGETILLVEDNDLLRTAATRILTRLGYRVFAAAGIDEAKRIAATEGPIHLLLTDVVMPGGSGRDVSLAVAAAHPAAKVLYMSGFTDDVIVQRGVLEPGVAFLLKPFTPDSLGRKVREVLDG